jgi:hypothetical protein
VLLSPPVPMFPMSMLLLSPVVSALPAREQGLG